ncbi:phosphatase PAP2 family protein [Candidatus Woesebacteria bacterium]|nr:phosphatase PAP2 family protein [Candidatus Woesebacteria bacterium]
MELFIAFIASILLWLMFVGLVLLWIIDGRIKKEQALHAFFSSTTAWTVSQMIKQIFPRPRPYQLNGHQLLTVTLNHYDGSFPSTHAALAFSIAFAVYLHSKKLGTFFMICAFLVALGRVLSNVHYAVDVVGGGIVGATTAYFLDKLHLDKLIGKKGK